MKEKKKKRPEGRLIEIRKKVDDTKQLLDDILVTCVELSEVVLELEERE